MKKYVIRFCLPAMGMFLVLVFLGTLVESAIPGPYGEMIILGSFLLGAIFGRKLFLRWIEWAGIDAR